MKYFNPSDYLREYYLNVSDENRTILSFFAEASIRVNGAPRHLDIGCGPTIYQIISIAHYASEIVCTDAYQESLDEVNRWRNAHPNAFDWKNFIKEALFLEVGRKPSSKEIMEREQEIRSKVRLVEMLDVSDKNKFVSFLNNRGPFGTISSVFALEVIAKSHQHLQSLARIIYQHLSAKGIFFIVMVEGGNEYKVGDTYLPNLKIDRHQLMKILSKVGFRKQKMYAKFVSSDRSDEGYKGIMLLACSK